VERATGSGSHRRPTRLAACLFCSITQNRATHRMKHVTLSLLHGEFLLPPDACQSTVVPSHAQYKFCRFEIKFCRFRSWSLRGGKIHNNEGSTPGRSGTKSGKTPVSPGGGTPANRPGFLGFDLPNAPCALTGQTALALCSTVPPGDRQEHRVGSCHAGSTRANLSQNRVHNARGCPACHGFCKMWP
jgi:hypothetical protein